ncbi:MAG: fatty acid desaturase [Pseudomonadota bacterium]
MARPSRIPKEFQEQNAIKMWLMVIHRVGMFFACLTASCLLVASDFPLGYVAPLFLITTALGSVALHNIGLLGHEGMHFTLAKDRYQSGLLGTLLSTMVPLHFNVGFALTHALHHWHTNTENDPDLAIFSNFRNLVSRFFLARSKASRAYLKDTVLLAAGKMPHRNQVGLPDESLKKLARWNLAGSVMFLVAYGVGIALSPGVFAVSFLSIYLLAVGVSGLRPYMEHAGTDTGQFSNSRSFANGLLTYVFGTINLHLAHHLHPQVPAYNLPRLYDWLKEQGHIPEAEAIEQTSTLGLMLDISQKPYGKSSS